MTVFLSILQSILFSAVLPRFILLFFIGKGIVMGAYRMRFSGMAAFLFVLLLMPLGHAAMILMEHFMQGAALNWAAFFLGVAGLLVAVVGSKLDKDSAATICGFLGGIMVWTGWIEFCFVYFANRYGIEPVIVDGVVATKPEYLLLMSSVGFWGVIMALYIFRLKTGCNFYSWVQRVFGIRHSNSAERSVVLNKSFTTFMESIMILWTCYLVLMFAYDDRFLGDRHPVTIVIAFACLVWSVWLFARLVRIRAMGYAVRYAVPTVVIFWNFVEVMGRIGIMDEIWTNPLKYKFEMLMMLVAAVALLIGIVLKRNREKRNDAVN